MRRALLPLVIAVLLVSCAPPGPPTVPNEREWAQLSTDYQWLEQTRKAQTLPPANAPRKQQLEVLIANHQKLEPLYVAFMDKLKEYYDRTGDIRAAQVMAREKITMGDEYITLLSRYDRALDLYRTALQLDPKNPYVQERITSAEKRRFVSMQAFAAVKVGMKEDEARALVGLPREDWIKQVVQNSRTYSVWIFPKSDGGAAAIYFDNGIVYHTNWNAAAPPAAAQTK